jgi:uncharacterized protein (TIGR02996 family)
MNEGALLRQILDDPEDDAPRLVYADWLEDHGLPERAQFIRTQIELARLDEFDLAREDLEAAAFVLHRDHGRGWLPDLPAWARPGEPVRGFVESVESDSKSTPRPEMVAPLFERLPLVGLSLNLPPVLKDFLAWPLLGRLRELEVCDSMSRSAWRRLLGSPHLGRLRVLRLYDWAGVLELAGRPESATLERLYVWASGRYGSALAALASSPHLNSLRVLSLGTDEDSRGVRLLARLLDGPLFGRLTHFELDMGVQVSDGALERLAPHLGGLRSLTVEEATLWGPGVEALAAGPLGALRELDLHNACVDPVLDPAAVAELGACPALGGLRRLGLRFFRHRKGMARAVARAPAWRGLLRLDLPGCAVDAEGVEDLLGSAVLAGVRRLGLGYNELGDAGAGALAAAPPLAGLRWLDLTKNGIGDEGAKALARSPHLGGLVSLTLAENPIGEEGWRALRRRFGSAVVSPEGGEPRA